MKTAKFIPPTIEEVEEYGASISYIISGEKFVNSYEQKGWMVGRNKMVSWKAAVRNWKANGWGKKGVSSKKTKLWPISGKTCSKQGCGLPAVYHNISGHYDSYSCKDHMPEKVKAEYE
jgi:hypothetical protein